MLMSDDEWEREKSTDFRIASYLLKDSPVGSVTTGNKSQ
jgi:hypothetical protein